MIDSDLRELGKPSLDLHLEKSVETYRNSLFNALDKVDEEVRQWFEEDIKNFKTRETAFYTRVISQLKEWYGSSSDEVLYLYFDIDETIVCRRNDKDQIRPSLNILLQDIKSAYPNVHFGICSSRSAGAVTTFIEQHPELGFEVGYSSRGLSSDPLDESWGTHCYMGHYNKVRAMIDIRKTYPNALLVDDIIAESFVEKKMGIPVGGSSFNGYPLLFI